MKKKDGTTRYKCYTTSPSPLIFHIQIIKMINFPPHETNSKFSFLAKQSNVHLYFISSRATWASLGVKACILPKTVPYSYLWGLRGARRSQDARGIQGDIAMAFGTYEKDS